MAVFEAPGVYYQTVDAGGLPVTPLRTDIVGFVGIAERGPIDTPVPIESWRQFASWFGEFSPVGFLAYAVRAFFENGGRRCWVVRIASKDLAGGAVSASALVSAAATPTWNIKASSEGIWGNALTFSIRERNLSQVAASTTDPDGHFSNVSNVNGFKRGTHVRIKQEGSLSVVWKVVSDVDPVKRRIYWVHPKFESRLVYDSPLRGFDLSLPILIQSVEYGLTVSEFGRLIRFYDRLSLIPENDAYGPKLLAPITPTIDPTTQENVRKSPEPIVIEELRPDVTILTGLAANPFLNVPLKGGKDGLASLVVYDFIGEPISNDDGSDAVAFKRRGLRALEELSEIGLLAIPDAQIRPIELNPLQPPVPCVPDPCIKNPPPDPEPFPQPIPEFPPLFGKEDLFRIQSEMIIQCELKRDRFALLDCPFEASHGDLAGIREALEWRARFDSKFAALYFPWVKVLDPLRDVTGNTRLLPPSGHVSGAIADTDIEIGVFKAPANRRVEWALDSGIEITDEQHGVLNTAGVNAIRNLGSRGYRIHGARTVSSDPDWRYVNVRRLMSMIEKAIEIALQWAVFEPNGALTRARAMMSITIFLLGLHENGALAGETPEESFFVKCDLDNNPPEQRDLGQLLVEVGIAPSKPFEFIVLRVGRIQEAIEIVEASGSFAGVGA
jgi:phage tail sheath protein FI